MAAIMPVHLILDKGCGRVFNVRTQTKEAIMVKKSDPTFNEIPKPAAEAGLRLARRIFETRGDHSEVHLGEEELAVMLSAAFQLGSEDGGKWHELCIAAVAQRDKLITALTLIAETPKSAPSVPQDIVRVRRIASTALRNLAKAASKGE
jgi:hypothetical protein